MELLTWIIVLLPVFQISASPLPVTDRAEAKSDKTAGEGSALEAIINVNAVETIPFTTSRSIRFTDMAYSNQRNGLICPGSGQCFWPKSSDGVVYIPYVIGHEYSDPERVQIIQALSAISTVSCIVFTPRSSETDYLNFRSLDGCWSFFGRGGGQQDISLSRTGCMQKNIISHEVMHALGFIHEHNRSDRDSYIKVLWDNIKPGEEDQFVKTDTNNLGTLYDYNSILHYNKNAFAKQYGLQTLVPFPDSTRQIGMGSWLTGIDVLKINRLYDCSEPLSDGESKTQTLTKTPTTTTTTTTTTTRGVPPPVVGPVFDPNKDTRIGCGMTVRVSSEDTGKIYSTNYPNVYPNNENCLWRIEAESPISLSFEMMDIQDSEGCTSDYISIYDVKFKTFIGPKLCGSSTPAPILSFGPILVIKFHTDGSVNNRGFSMSFRSLW